MNQATGLRSQAGTMTFTLPSKLLLNARQQVLLNITDYPHHAQLTINKCSQLVYKHTIPSTMTRIVKIELKDIPFDWKETFISLTWRKEDLRITLQPQGKVEPFYINSDNERSSQQVKVTSDGHVFNIGEGSSGFYMHQEGTYKSKPFALEHWEETEKYIRILLTGKSESGYMFESALCNLLLVSLVTGLETYLKTRFIELYQEGLELNTQLLVKNFSKKEEREDDAQKLISDDALIEYVKKINFQNYKHIKQAFNSFGIPLHQSINNNLISKVKTLVGYRHKIIHFSISLSMLNIDDYGAEPVFPSKEFIENSIKDFNDFITQLHSASLKS